MHQSAADGSSFQKRVRSDASMEVLAATRLLIF
jgi:hypothetical protein